VYIARGAVNAERIKSNPMNLIRVMPAKGSGLLPNRGFGVSRMARCRFSFLWKSGFFLLFADRKSLWKLRYVSMEQMNVN
jgi:hypothetical protein